MESFVSELGPKLPTMEMNLDIVDKVVDNVVDQLVDIVPPGQQMVSNVVNPVKKVSFQAEPHIIPDAPKVLELATKVENVPLSQTVKHVQQLKQTMDILNGPFRPSIMTLYFFIALVLLGLFAYYKK